MDSSLLLYALLVAGIVALPGLDMAYVASSSLTRGWPGGAAALAGIVAGGVLHLLAGLLGLGWLLQRQPALFNLLLVAGALYVAWIAWPLLRHATVLSAEAGAARDSSLMGIASRGLMTCLLNPKAYVFSVSVLPGFLSREPSRLLALMAITALTQTLIYGAVGLAAAQGRQRFVSQRWLPPAVGLLLLLTALFALASGWRQLSSPAT